MRYILCPTCAANFKEHPDDTREGWLIRRKEIKAKVPDDGSHRITIIAGGETVHDEQVPIIACDLCNAEIPEGSPATCVTMWQGQEPENWEERYDQANQASPSPD